jgi:hypothetical protein
MGLSLPLRVQASDSDGRPWEEMTTSEDASFGGVGFTLKHGVQSGQCVQMSFPLPKRFRRYDLSEPSYHVYGLVRNIVQALGVARVGAMFLGKQPPKGHEVHPTGRYLLPTDPAPAPKERRQYRRLEIFLNLKLLQGAEGARVEERTVAENLGKGGARVMTSLSVSRGDILEVEELGGPFHTRAEIKNVYVGKDNIPRLNLRFLDAEAPDRLVSAG